MEETTRTITFRTLTYLGSDAVLGRGEDTLFCNRGVYHQGWTAVTRHSTRFVMGAELPAFDDDVWELYAPDDWTQSNDISADNPEKLAELQRIFLIEAVKYGVFSQIRSAMGQAAQLDTLGDTPLAVITAKRESESAWFTMQDDLAALSTNHVHRVLDDANHQMVVADEDIAGESSQAILDVVNAVRTSTSLSAEAG